MYIDAYNQRSGKTFVQRMETVKKYITFIQCNLVMTIGRGHH